MPTLTVDEYPARSWKARLGYRLFRNPLVMFGIGPIWSLMIGPRIWSNKMRPRQRHSVIATNLALAIVIGAIFWVVGLDAWLLVQMPTAILAGTMGVFLFYVQHQFEDVYWESSEHWSYADAALQGSSYLKLPKLLQFFSGNIGLHHVHHLSAKIPNYNLQRAHDENPIFHEVPVLSVRDGLRSIRLKVIDPASGRLLTWGQVRPAAGQRSQPTISESIAPTKARDLASGHGANRSIFPRPRRPDRRIQAQRAGVGGRLPALIFG